MNNRNGKTGVITISAAEALVQRNIQLMRITLSLTALSFVTFSIILTSSYWVIINFNDEFFDIRKNRYIVRSTYGLIWECVYGRTSKTSMYG